MQGSCCLGQNWGDKRKELWAELSWGAWRWPNKAVKIQLYFHEKKGTICIVGPRETPFISDLWHTKD